MIPEPCGVPDNSETGQGSGKKPDNDVVPVVRHHHEDQRNETGWCVHGIFVPCGMGGSVKSKYKQEL